MLNTTNIHKSLIEKVPAISLEAINQINILSSYKDAILLPSNEIIDLEEFDINLTSSIYCLDLPSNKTNDIFYFNEKLHNKNYYNVSNFRYFIEQEYQQQLKYYEIDINFNVKNNLNVSFFLLEYENSKISNIIQLENNSTDFQVMQSTEFFEICVKLENVGLIYNLNFNVKEKHRKILNSDTVNFSADNFYNTAKEVTILENNNEVNILVNKNDKKHIYLSYYEENNKFSILPKNEIFSGLTFSQDLLTHLIMSKDETIEVIPMLIEYNSSNKINVKNLSMLNQEIINLRKDTHHLRFVLRVSGVGEINLKSFSLIELEDAPQTKRMDFDNRKDIKSLLSPQMKLEEYKIACIMDEFTFNSFNPEVQLYKVTPKKWKSVLLFVQPDLLFIESAWVGNNGDWNKKVAYYDEEQHLEIKSLIEYAKSLNIPVVFWNKEDPVHYDRFIETAKLCDYIFTTDKGRIPRYIKDCGHENVSALPFAAQPKNHNPIKIQKTRESKVSFAGSYYKHHEERSKDMDILLEASKEFGLVIYDRNYEKTSKGQMPNHMYPERYKPYVKGSLPFNLIDKSYKGYKYMINVNTVKHSETMFSRRVFEGLISGTPIISTYSLGMKMMFGDIIESSNNIVDLQNHLKKLNSNKLLYNKYALRGIREILLHHTYEQRMIEVLHAVGYTVKSNKTNIYFIAFVNDDEEIEDYIEIFKNQLVTNKKLIIVHRNIINYNNFYNQYNTDTIVGIDYSGLRKYINMKQLLGEGYISVLNSKNYYSENYALDLMLAKKYSAADIIGKSMYYVAYNDSIQLINKDSDYIYTPQLKIDRSIVKISLFDKFSMNITLDYLESKTDLSTLKPFGAKLFSSDSLNFIENGKEFKNKSVIEI